MLSAPLSALSLLLCALTVAAAPLHPEQALVKRQSCSRASQCTGALKSHWQHRCIDGTCKNVCDPGYRPVSGNCVPKTTAAVIPVDLATSPTSSTNALTRSGVTSFTGTNSNAIASWFRTNSAADSTNGHSWCGFPYNDQVPGFAPSVGTMLRNFGGSYERAATAYCGLEARFTTPDGKTATLFITDGFDDTWVRTPASVDVVIGSFSKLFGRYTTNKNDVVQGVKWTLTGRRNDQYKFKGAGSG